MKGFRVQDPWVVALAGLATAIGLFFAFDAGYARSIQAGRGTIPREFISQVVPLLPILLVTMWVARIPKQKLRKISKPLWGIAFFSLFLPMLPVIGVELNGARRWFTIPPIPFNFQPAEFVKVAAVLYLAAVFTKRREWKDDPRAKRSFIDRIDFGWLPKFKRMWPGLTVLIAAVIIEFEPDLGTAAVVMVIAYAMFLVGGVSRKTLVVGTCVLAVGVVGLVLKEPYRVERFEHHFSRWTDQNLDDTGYQTVQSELAMATGGVIGVGPGAGRAKHVMPAATTDFVLATIAEEFGLLGAWGVIAVLAGLTFRLVHLAQRCTDRYSALVLYGFASWIGVQSAVNVMMANGLLPAIGIPLPFVSSGGSSLMSLWLAIGASQAVLAQRAEQEDAVAADRDGWRHGRPRLSRA